MGILIKELHLPTERLYPLHLTVYSDGSAFCGHGIGKRSYEAIEVPVPHGRLGDLDALAEQCDDPYWCVWSSDIENAPTVIPAEEGTT